MTDHLPLSVERVTKRFRQGASTVHALRDVSCSVSAGEFVAIMGASGSGKSTLLHVMAGLTRPDAGRITVEGQDVAAMPDGALTRFRRRRIGLVFQQFNLIASLTARDNVLLPLAADGRAAAAGPKADGLLARLKMTERAGHRPDALSGGEQQRVAIARALVTDPAIVLADEPTGSLDSVSGQALCRLLKELNEEQRRTIVVVTHEPTVAVWAERVIVMKDGAVCAEFRTSDFPNAHALAAHYQDVVNLRAAS